MQPSFKLIALTSALLLTACASPRMYDLPKQEPGKAAMVLYSTTLNPTASLGYYIDNQKAGELQGDKVSINYLTPGEHTIRVNVPHISGVLSKRIDVKAGGTYFLNAYSISINKRLPKTTYYLETINEDAAMKYLRGENKSSWQTLGF